MQPKIWDDENPEFPKEGLFILREIGKSMGTLFKVILAYKNDNSDKYYGFK